MNRLSKYRHHFRTGLSVFLLFIVPVITFYLMEFYTHNPFKTMRPGIQFLNILFFELFMVLGLFLFKQGRIALWVETAVFALIGLANYFVLDFRSAPIMPWDLLSIRTAASVAGDYRYELNKQASVVLFLFLLVLAATYFCRIKVSRRKIRLPGILITLFLLAGFIRYTQSSHCLLYFRLYDKLFTPTTMAYRDGTVVAFCLQLQYLFVEKPSDYSAQKAEEILRQTEDSAADKESTVQAEDAPNIIVIMNEAFSDLNILGEFTANEDYIPYIRSLLNGADNTQSGYLGVSILGGNTANTEFEFLTGQTMAFLPQGSIPYQQYIKKETFSLAWWVKQMGYRTIAIHPYGATGWQRHQVYPLLGFDTFLSLEDFSNAEKLRKYVSDAAGYEKIIQLYEQKEPGQPLFVFHVTMQNHSSYTEAFSNFTPDVTIDGSDSFALSQYLSLLKVSDTEIKNLTDYFSAQEEKTLILFFGDHQPTDSVVRDIWKLNGKNSQALSEEDQRLRYRVPFFLWANYDIEEEADILTSPNYLGNLVLNAARLPLNSFHKFLDKLQQNYPVISSIEVQDASRKSYEVKDMRKQLLDYSILQYYFLMEKGERNEE